MCITVHHNYVYGRICFFAREQVTSGIIPITNNNNDMMNVMYVRSQIPQRHVLRSGLASLEGHRNH